MWLQASLCDYKDAYRLVKGSVTVIRAKLTDVERVKERERNNEKVIFKNCAPFTDCISEMHNTQVDNAKDLDVVKHMYNLAKYNDKNI